MRAGGLVWIVMAALSGRAADRMDFAQQNALVEKYCAVCHTDAARNGGLSLEHFDAAQAPPSLAAVLLSKITSGVLLKTVREADADSSAGTFVDRKMKTGAMGAAGIGVPDKATIRVLVHSLAMEADGASEWSVERRASTITASVLREMPMHDPGVAQVYRAIVSCDGSSGKGELQLAWAPMPFRGAIEVSADGRDALRMDVDGDESMGNGSGLVLKSRASVELPTVTLPAESLTVRGMFGLTVTFPFGKLPPDARRELRACFGSGAR